MIAFDTNVLVRFLVEDDVAQTARVRRLIERELAAGERVFVGEIVMCETVWVLECCYRFSRGEIVAALERLVRARQVVLGSADRVAVALDAFAAGKGDFTDYLIREDALAAGCERVATFDRALLSETGFVSP
ncbi:MAG: PIN domain-containing protein [Thermoanaerobaculaceae bacterium]